MKKRYYVYAAVICVIIAIALFWKPTAIQSLCIALIPFIFAIAEVWKAELINLWRKFCRWHTWELDKDDDRF